MPFFVPPFCPISTNSRELAAIFPNNAYICATISKRQNIESVSRHSELSGKVLP
jgi:hypothetical protein